MFKFQQILFVIGVLFFSPIKAQHEQVSDSLKQLLEHAETAVKQADLCKKLADHYFYTNIEEALKYAEQGLTLVPQGTVNTRAHLYLIKGLILKEFGIEEKTKKGLLYLDSALALYQQLNLPKSIVRVYSNRGNFYYSLAKFDLALGIYQEGVELAQALNDTTGMALNLSGIASIYMIQDDVERALSYIKKAYELKRARNSTQLDNDLYIYAINIGQIYSSIEALDSSLHYFNIALIYLNKSQHWSRMGIAYEPISFVYQKKEQLDSAIWYINKAIALDQYFDNKDLKLRVLTRLATIHFERGERTKSILCAEKNLTLAEKVGSYLGQFASLNTLIDNYVQLEDFKKVYVYQSKLIEIKKVLLAEEKQKDLDELAIQYETDKKEQENKLLAMERDAQEYKAERNEQFVYVMLVVLLLVIFIAYGAYQRTKIIAREGTIQLKHQLLRNQMNPHFIFNALIAIQSFVYKNEPRETDKYLSAFSKLMRGILENSTKEYIPLEEELKWLKHYLELQLLRFDHKFTYDVIVDSELDVYSMLIPPMLTQPFIENALEHGLKNVAYKGKIVLSFAKEKDALKITVEDNGIGIDVSHSKKKEEHHVSLATKITKERIQFLNKKAASKIYFDIRSMKQLGTVVSFKIPLKYT